MNMCVPGTFIELCCQIFCVILQGTFQNQHFQGVLLLCNIAKKKFFFSGHKGRQTDTFFTLTGLEK